MEDKFNQKKYMPNQIQIKRRTTGTGIDGIQLAEGELLWQEVDNQLLIKKSAADAIIIGGTGTATTDGLVTTADTAQTVKGTKNFSGTLNVSGTLQKGGIAITSSADELNKLTNVTATSNDFNRLAGVTAGVATNGKVVVVGDTGNVNFNAGQLSSTAVPTQDEHVANKKYVDSVAQGLDVKASVHVATTAALPECVYNNGTNGVGATLTATTNGGLSIDGHLPMLGESVLVKNQSAKLQNGIYTVTSAGAEDAPFILTRRIDADEFNQLTSGSFTFVEKGTANGSTGWVVSTSGSIVIGTNDISFTQFSSAGIADAGEGLQKTGTTFAVKSQSSSRIKVEPAGIDLAMTAVTAGDNKILFNVDSYGRITSASSSIPASANITIDCGSL